MPTSSPFSFDRVLRSQKWYQYDEEDNLCLRKSGSHLFVTYKILKTLYQSRQEEIRIIMIYEIGEKSKRLCDTDIKDFDMNESEGKVK